MKKVLEGIQNFNDKDPNTLNKLLDSMKLNWIGRDHNLLD